MLLFLCSCGGTGLPSRLDRFPNDLANPKLELSGIYQDGWLGEKASLMLQQPSGNQVLMVRGMIPKIGEGPFATDVELRMDDKTVARQSFGTGDFRLSGRIAEGGGSRRIALTFGSSQELPGGDGRSVGARLSFIGFEAPGGAIAPTSTRPDIINGPGVQLGAGWGILETFGNETFRWVANDAQFRLAAVSSAVVEVSALLEAGPGLGTTSFMLSVLDPSGKQVATTQVRGRGTVKLLIPVEPGKVGEFHFHVNGGGKATPNDPRILNFRVFQLTATPTTAHAK